MGASVIALPETIALPALGARDAVALRLDVEVRRDLELSADDALAMDGLIVSRRAGRIHLGKVTFSTAISLAVAEGATEFDFLKGAEGVKYLWPVNERVTIDAEVYSGRSGAQLTRARRASRELASAVVKSMRDWFPMGRRG